MIGIKQRALMILNYCACESKNKSLLQDQIDWSQLKQQLNQNNVLKWIVLAPILSIVFSIIITQSILMLSGDKPLNILLMFFVLILMPWLNVALITFIKTKLKPAFSSLKSSESALQQSFIKFLISQNTLIFAIASLVCIWFNLLVKDVPLGWSSTFDISAKQLSEYANVISFAWSSWFESASLNEAWFENSQFYYLQPSIDNSLLQSMRGWKFLMMSLICFSILPRAVLLILNWFRLYKQLNSWLKWQLPVLKASFLTDVESKAKVEKTNVAVKEFNLDEFDFVLSWHVDTHNKEFVSLGQGSWNDDLDIITKLNNNENIKQVLFIVDVKYSPTAELSDLITQILEKNKTVVVAINNQSKQILREGLVYSWQEFSNDLKIASFSTDQF